MEQVVAKEGLLNDAQWFLDTVQSLVDKALTASSDKTLTSAEIYIDINPLSDRGDMKDVSGNAFLIEETLSDDSKVYTIEIFS